MAPKPLSPKPTIIPPVAPAKKRRSITSSIVLFMVGFALGMAIADYTTDHVFKDRPGAASAQ